MSLSNADLIKFNKNIIKRLFVVLDLTNQAKTDKDFENIERAIMGIETELRGCLNYYSDVVHGDKMTNVLMKISGIKTIPDYNVRRKAIFDSKTIIDNINKELQ